MGCIALAACSRPPRTTGPLPQDAYVWQRVWSETVVSATIAARGKMRELVPLAAEVELTRTGLKKIQPRIPLHKLKSNSPIGLALRVGSLPSQTSSGSSEVRELSMIARNLVVEAQDAGLKLSEFQLDFDCAASKLEMYRAILGEIQKTVAPIPVHITVLPSWMSHPEFGPLVKQSGAFILQVHAVSVPSAGMASVLCNSANSKHWVEQAARFGVPFRVALPTYSSGLVYDENGRFLQVISEVPASNRGYQVKWVQANPSELAALVRDWTADRPQNLTGIIWYRLPVRTDSMNWRWPTFAAVMEGRKPLGHLHVEVSGTNPADLFLINDGELDLNAPNEVALNWAGGDLVAADGLNGFQLETGKKQVILRRDSSITTVLQPGDRMAIGWLRFNSPAIIHVNETQ